MSLLPLPLVLSDSIWVDFPPLLVRGLCVHGFAFPVQITFVDSPQILWGISALLESGRVFFAADRRISRTLHQSNSQFPCKFFAGLSQRTFALTVQSDKRTFALSVQSDNPVGMAEGVGFEPTVGLSLRSISSRVPSTGLSHPSLKNQSPFWAVPKKQPQQLKSRGTQVK